MRWPWRRDDRIIIWVVDDRRENQVMIRRSFAQVERHVAVVPIHSCTDFHRHVDHCTNADRPHLIFMDFFMGDEYGTTLVKHLRNRRYPVGYPVIIGHSSNLEASAEIVKQGGDFVLEKIKGLPTSRAIETHFDRLEKIHAILNTRMIPGHG